MAGFLNRGSRAGRRGRCAQARLDPVISTDLLSAAPPAEAGYRKTMPASNRHSCRVQDAGEIAGARPRIAIQAERIGRDVVVAGRSPARTTPSRRWRPPGATAPGHGGDLGILQFGQDLGGRAGARRSPRTTQRITGGIAMGCARQLDMHHIALGQRRVAQMAVQEILRRARR